MAVRLVDEHAHDRRRAVGDDVRDPGPPGG